MVLNDCETDRMHGYALLIITSGKHAPTKMSHRRARAQHGLDSLFGATRFISSGAHGSVLLSKPPT